MVSLWKRKTVIYRCLGVGGDLTRSSILEYLCITEGLVIVNGKLLKPRLKISCVAGRETNVNGREINFD